MLKKTKEAILAASYGESSDPSMIHSFWKSLWRLKMQGKIKILIWRFYHDLIPVASNLIRRGCNVWPNCKVCGFSTETSVHVVLECWWAKSFWTYMGLQEAFSAYNFRSMAEWIWFCFNQFPPETFIRICYGVSTIWYNRNLNTHDREGLQFPAAYLVTKDRVNQYLNPGFKFSISSQVSEHTWLAPPVGVIKINCDGAWCKSNRRAGIACVARDCEGVLLGVRAEWRHDVSSSLEAEGDAFLKAMEWAVNENWVRCQFETDCAGVYNLILKGCSSSSASSSWAQRCAALLMRYNDWQISLILRDANILADSYAKKAASEQWSWTVPNAIPSISSDLALYPSYHV